MAKAVQAAHSVASTNAVLTADGKVSGSTPENGCKLLGVWSQGPTPTLIWLDITLSECKYADFNRRYNGSFILARPDASGKISLNALGVPYGPDSGKSFDVTGTVRR